MSKRILVVEDQADNRRILQDLLTRAGYEIILAENGQEALEVVARERPNLILMDIQLPLLDGYEATRRIKANPALRAIPIIVITSYALSGDESKAKAAGCDGRCRTGLRLSVPRPPTSSAAALGRTATSRASTLAFAMSYSTARSSTL